MAYNGEDDKAGLSGYVQFNKYTHTHIHTHTHTHTRTHTQGEEDKVLRAQV